MLILGINYCLGEWKGGGQTEWREQRKQNYAIPQHLSLRYLKKGAYKYLPTQRLLEDLSVPFKDLTLQQISLVPQSEEILTSKSIFS